MWEICDDLETRGFRVKRLGYRRERTDCLLESDYDYVRGHIVNDVGANPEFYVLIGHSLGGRTVVGLSNEKRNELREPDLLFAIDACFDWTGCSNNLLDAKARLCAINYYQTIGSAGQECGKGTCRTLCGAKRIRGMNNLDHYQLSREESCEERKCCELGYGDGCGSFNREVSIWNGHAAIDNDRCMQRRIMNMVESGFREALAKRGLAEAATNLQLNTGPVCDLSPPTVV